MYLDKYPRLKIALIRANLGSAILAFMVMIAYSGCSNSTEQSAQGESQLEIAMNALVFTDANAKGKVKKKEIKWEHVFGGTGVLQFTNISVSPPVSSTYSLDMADFEANGTSYTLVDAEYEISLNMDETTPVAYVPVSAEDDIVFSEDDNLILKATTNYGMVLLDTAYVDAKVPPTFTVDQYTPDEMEYELILNATQNYYYLYVPGGTTGILTVKETLYGNILTKSVAVNATVIDALRLVASDDSELELSLTLEPFAIESEDWQVLLPTPGETDSTFTDGRDGRVYKKVNIGGQVWMAENLKYLPDVHDNLEFKTEGTKGKPAYGVYEYDGSHIATAKSEAHYATYGVLYNWYAVDQADICPAGWHVPTDPEWTTLTNYIGGEGVAGGKLKEASTTNWASPNTGATDEYGFTFRPGGERSTNGSFVELNYYGHVWTASQYNSSNAWYRHMEYHDDDVDVIYASKANGLSVRCVQDN